jgi:hypothetical protein
MGDIEAMLAECRQQLAEKEKNCTTNQLSLIQNRRMSLDRFEQTYADRERNPLYEKVVTDNFLNGLILIKKEIEAI